MEEKQLESIKTIDFKIGNILIVDDDEQFTIIKLANCEPFLEKGFLIEIVGFNSNLKKQIQLVYPENFVFYINKINDNQNISIQIGSPLFYSCKNVTSPIFNMKPIEVDIDYDEGKIQSLSSRGCFKRIANLFRRI